jgi:hypothetical protein
VYDRRTGSNADPLVEWQAHNGAVSACALSADVPGMLVTGSVEKTIKVWDARGCSDGKIPELVYERPSKAGAVFSASLCPLNNAVKDRSSASPFSLAFAGAKGLLVVTDLAVESKAVRERFADSTPATAMAVIAARASRLRFYAPGGGLDQSDSMQRDSDDGGRSSDDGKDGDTDYETDSGSEVDENDG